MKEPNRGNLQHLQIELENYDSAKGIPEIFAYVFTRGREVKQLPVRIEKDSATGTVDLDDTVFPDDTTVKICTTVKTIKDLDSHNPFIVTRNAIKEKIRIPEPFWLCWIKKPYWVTGVVKKKVGNDLFPLCMGEVDIYDVDIGRCFPLMPLNIIRYIQRSIIDIIIDPPPIQIEPELPETRWPGWWGDSHCGTPTGPPRPLTTEQMLERLGSLPGEWSFAKERFNKVASVNKNLDSYLDMQNSPENAAFLDREFIPGVKISQLIRTNPEQFRELLVTKFDLLRPYLCWWPWIFLYWWPYCYWYSLEKLGTAQIQAGGHFTEKVMLSICRRDIPDLWLVVRQKVSGVERVIYARQPAPCFTAWNHKSGKKIDVIVTYPGAITCYPEPETDNAHDKPWIVPLAIGNYSLKRIYGTGAGPAPVNNTSPDIGLYEEFDSDAGGTIDIFRKGPFGGTIGVRILFSDALEGMGVKYYLLKYRVNGTGEWNAFSHTVVRHYPVWNAVTNSTDFVPYLIGPLKDRNNLFEIPPKKAPNGSSFFVVDETVDLMNGYLDTTRMRIDAFSDTSYGFVDIKLELYDAGTNRINPVNYQSTSIPILIPSNTDIWNTITTTDPLTVNTDLIQNDPEQPAVKAFIFRLQIDNRSPTVSIDEPELVPSGQKAGSCGMLAYNIPPAVPDTTLIMNYRVSHPRRFAMYRFSLYRGPSMILKSGYGIEGQAKSNSDPFTVNFAEVKDHPTDPLADGIRKLLGPCPEAAAFSEHIYAWNMAFDGRHRVGPDASAVRAFALTPKK